MSLQEEKTDIEQSIARAREGVGERIDELDRRLRSTLDVKTFAQEHAPQLIAGGAALGFLVGFVSPKTLRRLIALGVPPAPFIVYVVIDPRTRIGMQGGA